LLEQFSEPGFILFRLCNVMTFGR